MKKNLDNEVVKQLLAVNENFSQHERRILDIITSFCMNECPSCNNCPEEDCALFRIESVITGKSK